MSFDLGVWYSSKLLTDYEAGKVYTALCKGTAIEPLIEPHAGVAQFIRELTARYPQLNDVPDDQIDECPWNSAFDMSAGYCITAMAWSRVEEVAPVVMELAEKCGLVCYDPQTGTVLLPPQLRSGAE